MKEQKLEQKPLDAAMKARLERFRLRSEKEAATKKQVAEKKRRKFFDAL